MWNHQNEEYGRHSFAAGDSEVHQSPHDDQNQFKMDR